MIQGNLLRWCAVLVVGTFAIHGPAAESWDIGNNSVTYSVFQDNFSLSQTKTKFVDLSKLNLAEVASHEGGTAANYMLSSVVLSMNGTVYGTIKVINNSESSITSTYVDIYGTSKLTYGSASTPDESYSGTVTFPTIDPGGEYTAAVNVLGSATPQTVTITQDLERFLYTGVLPSTITVIGAFPVSANLESEGTDYSTTTALKGKADISVTYNYTVVPEPTSMALVTLGCAVLALRRKRVALIAVSRNK